MPSLKTWPFTALYGPPSMRFGTIRGILNQNQHGPSEPIPAGNDLQSHLFSFVSYLQEVFTG